MHHLPCPFFIPAQVFRGQPLHREVLSTESDLCASYSTWIRDWTAHLTGVSSDTKVPPAATAITTPLVQAQWLRYLSDHPNDSLINFYCWYISGLQTGFQQASVFAQVSSQEPQFGGFAS